MKRSIFFDSDLQAQYEKEGYVIVPIFNNEDVDTLLCNYFKLNHQKERAFFVTLHYCDSKLKKEVDSMLKKSLDTKLDDILINYKPIFGSYAVKFPNNASIVEAHQDYSFVDEDEFDSLNVWFPLTTTTFLDGSLHIYPGSHKWPKTIRGSNTGSAWESIHSELAIERLKELSVPIGSAVIYNHRLIHASPPNLSTESRIAGAMAYIPNEADLIHYERVDETLNVYSIDPSFFYDYTHAPNVKISIPQRFKIIHTQQFKNEIFTKKHLTIGQVFGIELNVFYKNNTYITYPFTNQFN